MLNLKKLIKKMLTTESVQATKVGSAWTSGNINAYRAGGTVTVKFSGASIGSVSSRTTIARIPEGFRPPAEMVGKPDGSVFVIISTDGYIKVDPPANGTFYVNITYAAKLGGGVLNNLIYVNSRPLLRKAVVVC